MLIRKALEPSDSGAPAEPHTQIGRKGNPCIDFLMVMVASGITCGRVRTTTTATTELRKMAAILQLTQDYKRNINISSIEMFFTASCLCILRTLRLFKLKTEGQTT